MIMQGELFSVRKIKNYTLLWLLVQTVTAYNGYYKLLYLLIKKVYVHVATYIDSWKLLNSKAPLERNQSDAWIILPEYM